MSDKLIQFNHLEVQNTAMAEIMKTMSFNTMIGILFRLNIECINHFCMNCLLVFFHKFTPLCKFNNVFK